MYVYFDVKKEKKRNIVGCSWKHLERGKMDEKGEVTEMETDLTSLNKRSCGNTIWR